MKHLIVNLKRFDIPKALNGISDISRPEGFAEYILKPLTVPLREYPDLAFTFFFPEAHLIQARALTVGSANIRIGCQANFWQDVSAGGNFGAFTSFHPASAMKALGCGASLIGHCEERRYLNQLYAMAGIENQKLVNSVLNQEIRLARDQGMEVCYCIGEADTQLKQWDRVLTEQLEQGLEGVERSGIIIGYEPLWSIGPGKKPADQAYIEKVVRLVKAFDSRLRVIYGGGVKQDNASALASIGEMDGGLIGLTNFTDNIGFHPDEFLEIVRLYHSGLT